MTKTPPHYAVVDRLAVEVHATRAAMGLAAARATAAYLAGIIARQGEARVIFACAPSQDEFLGALVDPARCGVLLDWSRITAFHMDEYVGIRGDAPQSFRRYLHEHLLARVGIGSFHAISAEEADVAAVCQRYSALLAQKPIDLICLGIGENGHIAFNDPPVADFDDPVPVKRVELDHACRQQQVNDGCFPNLDAVPTHAITLTIPALFSGAHLFCMVPGRTKAAAVAATLNGPVTTDCPSSILRRHPDCTLYTDTDSYGKQD